MGWGDPFKSAWNSAGNAAKETAKKAKDTASSAVAYIDKKAHEAAAKTQQMADYAQRKAAEAQAYAAQKSQQAATAAHNAYQAGKLAAQDAAHKASEAANQAWAKAKRAPLNAYDAYDSGRMFDEKAAGNPTAQCPLATKKSSTGSSPSSSAKVKKQPNRENPCRLWSMAMTCEHGRTAGKEGILMVVPTSVAARGDAISMNLKFEGGCEDHPSWTVGGLWETSGRTTSNRFSAQSLTSGMVTPLTKPHGRPNIYPVSASGCIGDRGYEVHAYPGTKDSFKVDVSGIVQKIREFLKYIPVTDDDIGKWTENNFKGSIKFEGKWEESSDWQAYYGKSIVGSFDPLLGGKVEFQLYPPGKLPGIVYKYLKMGVYLEITAGIGFDLSYKARYWPYNDRTERSVFAFTGGGGLGVELSLKVHLFDKDVISAKAAGSTSGKIEMAAEKGDEIELGITMKWEGLNAEFSVEALWGWVEFKRSSQLIGPHDFKKWTWHPGS